MAAIGVCCGKSRWSSLPKPWMEHVARVSRLRTIYSCTTRPSISHALGQRHFAFDEREGRATRSSEEDLYAQYIRLFPLFFSTQHRPHHPQHHQSCPVALATGVATLATSPPTAPRPSDCATTARKLVSIGDDDLSDERAGDLQRRACQKFSLRRGECAGMDGWAAKV